MTFLVDKVRPWAVLIVCLVALIGMAALPARSSQAELAAGSGEGPTQSSEYAVKAAFIYNFAQFVDWPPEAFSAPDGPLVIATVGGDPFHRGLERAVNGKRVQDHPLVVRHLSADEPITGCHIVFVAGNDDRRVQTVLAATRGKPALTVGDGSERFLQWGGVVRFYLENNKVRFEVNVKAAEQAGLKISAKLLKLARIYTPQA